MNSNRLFLFVCVVLLGSCGSSTSPSTTFNNFPSPGTLTGQVLLYDSIGYQWGHLEGVQVSLDQTILSTLTDAGGYWEIGGIPAGAYDITFSKGGYGRTRLFGQQVMGPGIMEVRLAVLASIPTDVPVLDSVAQDSEYVLFFSHGVARPTFFIDRSPNIASDQGHLFLINNGSAKAAYTVSGLKGQGILSGKRFMLVHAIIPDQPMRIYIRTPPSESAPVLNQM